MLHLIGRGKWQEFSEPVITLLRSGVHLRRGQWRSSVNVRRYSKTTFFQLVDDVNLKKKVALLVIFYF